MIREFSEEQISEAWEHGVEAWQEARAEGMSVASAIREGDCAAASVLGVTPEEAAKLVHPESL